MKEQKQEAQSLQESTDLDSSSLTVESLIELYLQRYIENRRAPSAKVIPRARKRKGQIEARRTLHADVVAKLGGRAASEITRKDVVTLIVGIIDRGAKKMLNIDPWTPHDLRRTVRTGLSKLQCPNELAEAVLGHARKGIEGTYDLHSYDQGCRVWLQKWADHMDSIENTIKINWKD